ncbi:CBN-ROP-1 protein [Aphelenchoides avenae]|nr:CBN-ROP-1 protein [Aphelenchus avenae]
MPEMVEAENDSQAIRLINAVVEAKSYSACEPAAEKRCAELIREHGLVREHMPTELLNSTAVWAALLEKTPMTALIRNLSVLSTHGLIAADEKYCSSYVDSVVAKLTDEAAIQKARIHPVCVLLAAATYNKGRGFRGSLEWSVNKRVEAALNKAFLKAFKNVEPTGKRYCLAIDVSGSMCSPVGGGSGVISCREASIAMSKVECMAFQDKFVPLPFKKGARLADMVRLTERLPFGNTDCALPMLWASEKHKKFDVFMVFTDCETWAGKVSHCRQCRCQDPSVQGVAEVPQQDGIPDAKLVVMGMTSTNFTIADPSDPGMLDVCGFDSAIPELVRSFVLGQL